MLLFKKVIIEYCREDGAEKIRNLREKKVFFQKIFDFQYISPQRIKSKVRL